MTSALTYLAWTLALALAQVFLAAAAKRKQDGLQWAAGSRDQPREYAGVAARMVRAQTNLFETLPLFVGAVLIGHLAGLRGGLETSGAAVYFWARLIYIPLYAYGLNPWRTLAWGASVLGLLLVLVPLLWL